MNENNEREDEENPEDWEDKTKDAFFTDLLEMEDQLDEEAYELVEHGISLIDQQFYDDAIETKITKRVVSFSSVGPEIYEF